VTPNRAGFAQKVSGAVKVSHAKAQRCKVLRRFETFSLMPLRLGVRMFTTRNGARIVLSPIGIMPDAFAQKVSHAVKVCHAKAQRRKALPRLEGFSLRLGVRTF
jgi:hypothetical protein